MTARTATVTTADSQRRWNSAVQISGLSRKMPTPEVDQPAAWIRAKTDPVYSSGTFTVSQPGARRHGTKTISAATAGSNSRLTTASDSEAGPGGSSRLASSMTAKAANGEILVTRPSRCSNGLPGRARASDAGERAL